MPWEMARQKEVKVEKFVNVGSLRRMMTLSNLVFLAFGGIVVIWEMKKAVDWRMEMEKVDRETRLRSRRCLKRVDVEEVGTLEGALDWSGMTMTPMMREQRRIEIGTMCRKMCRCTLR